jgi:hypothetical protein
LDHSCNSTGITHTPLASSGHVVLARFELFLSNEPLGNGNRLVACSSKVGKLVVIYIHAMNC